MTTRKHLKAGVRARMDHTGERYTTARRHLTGAAADGSGPAPIAGAVPGYDTFGAGRHHDSALLTRLLAASAVTDEDGAALDEAVVAGLAGGIGFMYFTFSYADAVPTMTIVPRIHPRPFLAGALERAGLAHRVSETTSAAKAARELDELLTAGRAAICTVDRAALPWHAWPAEYAGAEPYDVGVAGRAGELVLLDDECRQPIAFPAPELAAARAAHRKSRHRLLALEPGADRVDLAAAARSAVAVTVHDLVEDVMPNNFAGNFGLRGLAKWADAVADRRGAKGWSRLFDSGPAFGSAMRRLYDCLTVEYASPGAMRPLYADFLRAVRPALGEAAGTAAERYAAAGELWSAVAGAAVDGPLAAYRELAEARRRLLVEQGAAATGELHRLAAEQDRLVDGLDVTEADRSAALDRIAELAARLVPVEREACAALSAI